MEIFRKLANNFFFKIILGFVALSFVMFGISGFILGNPNSWVAKVGGKTISLNNFNRALNSDKKIISASTNSQEATQYLESQQFKSDVLSRLVNAMMIENLQQDFKVFANKKAIYKSIARDVNFKDENGKFSQVKFENFLRNNGLNEERYISEIENEIISTMILQTLATNVIINYQEVIMRENFRNEKRFVNLVTINKKSVKNVSANQQELKEFFAENKFQYKTKELRKVNYLLFSKENFSKDLKITDEKIYQYYQENKDDFTGEEKRNFYHIIFKEEQEAQDFSNKIKAKNKQERKAEFLKLAQKDLKKISMNSVNKRDLFATIANDAFALELNEVSAPIQSPLGFHIFLVNEIKAAKLLPFSEVKSAIKTKITNGFEDKIMQEKITKIDEEILATNSLEKVAQKFNLGKVKSITIDENSHDINDNQIKELEDFIGFNNSAFSMKEGQISKIFYAKNSKGFYILQLEKIYPSRQLELAEINTKVKEDLIKEKSLKTLKNLANKVSEEVTNNPENIEKIAQKFGLTFEKMREISRISYLNLQGRKIPFQSALSKAVFDLKINEASKLITQNEDEYTIAVLKEIKKNNANTNQISEAQNSAVTEFRNEIMNNYNDYLLKKYPVKVNEKIFAPQK